MQEGHRKDVLIFFTIWPHRCSKIVRCVTEGVSRNCENLSTRLLNLWLLMHYGTRFALTGNDPVGPTIIVPDMASPSMMDFTVMVVV